MASHRQPSDERDYGGPTSGITLSHLDCDRPPPPPPLTATAHPVAPVFDHTATTDIIHEHKFRAIRTERSDDPGIGR